MRKALLLILISLLLAACGGGVETPQRAQDRAPGAGPPIELPPPTEVLPAFLAYSEIPFEAKALTE